jgi:hypothetical protein
LVLATEGSDELALFIEYKNGGVVFKVLATFVDHIDAILRIDRDIMGSLPRIL